MRIPISLAIEKLTQTRLVNDVEKLSLAKWGQLNFQTVDSVRFPALELSYQALRSGGSAPTVLNGANEIAVSKFLLGEIKFIDIVRIVEKVLLSHNAYQFTSIDQIYEVDVESRKRALEVIKELR
jgi:1-deoxy-D-xylulose-5-phosphate reductoisomerase